METMETYATGGRADELMSLRESLDSEEQTLLILRVDKGMSWEDIAEVMRADVEQATPRGAPKAARAAQGETWPAGPGAGAHRVGRQATGPVPGQNSDRPGTIDDSSQGLESPRLDAPPPRSPPADALLSHALSTPSGDREPGAPPTARHIRQPTSPRRPALGPGLLGPAARGVERVGRGPRHRPAGHRRALASRRVSPTTQTERISG